MPADVKKKTQKPTLRSIARELDLSVMTVVRTLKGNSQVSEPTRLRVMQRVRELRFDYRSRSRKARAERLQRAAIYCPDVKFYGDNLFNFFLHLYYYCVRKLKTFGVEAVLLPQSALETPSPEVLAEYGSLLILGPFLPGESVLKAWKTLCPELRIVSVLGDPLPVPMVAADDFSGGVMAARKLYELGHRHTAVFSAMHEQSVQKRFAGFCGEMFRLDESCRIDRIFVPVKQDHLFPADLIQKSLEAYFSSRRKEDLPTAVFATGGYFSLMLADFLKKKGLAVPEDISILGYDDLDAMKQHDPPIDRIAFDLKQTAAQAASLLAMEQIPPRMIAQIENCFLPGKSIKQMMKEER